MINLIRAVVKKDKNLAKQVKACLTRFIVISGVDKEIDKAIKHIATLLVDEVAKEALFKDPVLKNFFYSID